MTTVGGGHLRVVETLVAAAVDVNIRGTFGGLTVLHAAAGCGHDQIVVSTLLLNGAEKDALDNNGGTPLMAAATAGHLPAAETLTCGRRRRFQHPQHCRRLDCLHSAAGRGHDKMVSALLLGGATKDEFDSNGKTPLVWAVIEGHLRVVEALVAAGADLHARLNAAGLTRSPLGRLGWTCQYRGHRVVGWSGEECARY